MDLTAFFLTVYALVANALGITNVMRAASARAAIGLKNAMEELDQTVAHAVGRALPRFIGIVVGVLLVIVILAFGAEFTFVNPKDAEDGMMDLVWIVWAVATAGLVGCAFWVRRNGGIRFMRGPDGEVLEHVVHFDANGDLAVEHAPVLDHDGNVIELNGEIQTEERPATEMPEGGSTIRVPITDPSFRPDRVSIVTSLFVMMLGINAVTIMLFLHALLVESRLLFAIAFIALGVGIVVSACLVGMLDWFIRKSVSALEVLLKITVEPVASLLPGTTLKNAAQRIGELNVLDQARLGHAIIRGVVNVSVAFSFTGLLVYTWGPSLTSAMWFYGTAFGVVIIKLISNRYPAVRVLSEARTEAMINFVSKHTWWWLLILLGWGPAAEFTGLGNTLTALKDGIFYVIGRFLGWIAGVLNGRRELAKGWSLKASIPMLILSIGFGIGFAVAFVKHLKSNFWKFGSAIASFFPALYFLLALLSYDWEKGASEGVTLVEPNPAYAAADAPGPRTRRTEPEEEMPSATPEPAPEASASATPGTNGTPNRERERTDARRPQRPPPPPPTATANRPPTTPRAKSEAEMEAELEDL